jgi:hypothetical protein
VLNAAALIAVFPTKETLRTGRRIKRVSPTYVREGQLIQKWPANEKEVRHVS